MSERSTQEYTEYYRAKVERGETGRVEERLADSNGNEATIERDADGNLVEVSGDIEPIEHFYGEDEEQW